MTNNHSYAAKLITHKEYCQLITCQMQRLLHLIYSYFLAFVQHFHFIEFVGLDNAHSNQMWSIIFCLEYFFIVLCFSSLRKECFEQVFNQIKNALRYNCRHHQVSMYIVAPQVVILYFLLIQKYTHTLSRRQYQLEQRIEFKRCSK